MGRLILGSLLAAVAMFIFGFLFWAVSPVMDSQVKVAPNQEQVQQDMRSMFPENGFYLVPMGDQQDENWQNMHKQGPVVTLHISDGKQPNSPTMMAAGFVYEFIAIFLVAFLLKKCSGSLTTYGSRLTFVAVAGFVIAFYGNVGNVIWWGQTASWLLAVAVYDIVAWFIAGLVLAHFVRD